MLDLVDCYVTLLGDGDLELTGWTLQGANDISPNGRAIVGRGINPTGNQEAWIAIIPEPSTALLFAWGLVGLAGGRRRRLP